VGRAVGHGGDGWERAVGGADGGNAGSALGSLGSGAVSSGSWLASSAEATAGTAADALVTGTGDGASPLHNSQAIAPATAKTTTPTPIQSGARDFWGITTGSGHGRAISDSLLRIRACSSAVGAGAAGPAASSGDDGNATVWAGSGSTAVLARSLLA
jgi:hypothetical protein